MILALSFAGWARASAAAPTISWDSYGWFSASGMYSIEYWVDVYDSDGDLVSTRVTARDEYLQMWSTTQGRGNNWHMQTHGWGLDIGDGEIAATAYASDLVGDYSWDLTLYF